MTIFSNAARSAFAGLAALGAIGATEVAAQQRQPTFSGVKGNNFCNDNRNAPNALCIKTDPPGVHLVHSFRSGHDEIVGICSAKTISVGGQVACPPDARYSTDRGDIDRGLRGISLPGYSSSATGRLEKPTRAKAGSGCFNFKGKRYCEDTPSPR